MSGRRTIRSCLALASSMAIGALGAGCGTSRTNVPPVSQSTATSTATATAGSSASTSRSTTGSGDAGLSDAGTLMQSDGQGTTLSEHWKIGPLRYSSPPTDVLSACNANYPSTIAQLASSQAEVTVSYTEGTQPLVLVADSAAGVQGSTDAGWTGVTAFLVDGQWQCGAGDGPGFTTNIQPHSSTTYPVWILSQVLSNAMPRVPTRVSSQWSFNPGGITAGASSNRVTASGPHAVNCDGSDMLMLFAHAPLEYPSHYGSGSVKCTAAKG